MIGRLSEKEVGEYHERGYLFPKPILTPEKCASLVAGLEKRIAPLRVAYEKDFPTHLPAKMGDGIHPLESLILPVVREPALLSVVESLVSGDVLLRNVDLFVKEPQTVRGLRWHMDTEYGGDHPAGIVTAWIALTPSTHANGALWFAPGSHRRPSANPASENYHRSAQGYFPPVQARLCVGEASFHHGRLLHSSGANQTQKARWGLAIRFFGSDLVPEVAQCGEPVNPTLGFGEEHILEQKGLFPFTWWSSSAKHGDS